MYNLRDSMSLDKTVAQKYRDLDLGRSVIATYIWVDDFGVGDEVRSKARTLDFEPVIPQELPRWGHPRNPFTKPTEEDPDYERYLQPVAIYNDPFRGGKHKLVMCEITNAEDKPAPRNSRRRCAEIMELARDQKPWFGMEQEYVLFDVDGQPFGWPKHGLPKSAGKEHPIPPWCGVGAHRVCARDVSDAHYHACLYAGLQIFGTNSEATRGQWEYQLGPLEGIAAADQLWVSRYILQRVAEDFGVVASFSPKAIEGDTSPSGCHFNFSTKAMREEGGIDAIKEAIERLRVKHLNHIAYYAPNEGKANEIRLTGEKATTKIDEFSSGVGSKFVTVRIPKAVADVGKGYFEDRRPSSNCDPYLVITALGTTCCLANGERRLSKEYVAK